MCVGILNILSYFVWVYAKKGYIVVFWGYVYTKFMHLRFCVNVMGWFVDAVRRRHHIWIRRDPEVL